MGVAVTDASAAAGAAAAADVDSAATAAAAEGFGSEVVGALRRRPAGTRPAYRRKVDRRTAYGCSSKTTESTASVTSFIPKILSFC